MYNNKNMMRMKKCSSSSSNILTHLSELSNDLLTEIFTKIPFRSTSRCKCVSKRWLDLVSSPSFVRFFMSNQINMFFAVFIFLSSQQIMLTFPPGHLDSDLDDNDEEAKKKTLSSPEIFIKGTVCGCSENVFLCSDNRYTSGYGYFLCDPLTKEMIQIPSLETRKEGLYAVGFSSGHPYYTFDLHDKETKNRHNWRTLKFSEKCFRVVIIRSFIARHFEFEVNVWCSETGRWKTHLVRCTYGFAFAPHWSLSFAFEGSLYFMGRTSIFVYDPYHFVGETLNYPKDSDPMNIMSFGFLGSSNRKLRISEIVHNDLWIWEVLDGENWDLVYHVDFSLYLPREFCNNYYKHVGGFHPHHEDIVYLCSYADGIFVAELDKMKFSAIPGYEKCDLSPFHLVVPFLPSSPKK